MSSAPRFSSSDYTTLFERINAVRGARDAFLEGIAAGAVDLHAIFAAANDPVISGMKVLPAVEAMPSTGKVQTRRAFADVGIGEGDHIGAVSQTSLAALPEALERHQR